MIRNCTGTDDHMTQRTPGPTGDRREKLGMRSTIEVATEICVNNFLMAGIDQLADPIHSVQRAAVLPIGVLFRLQIGLENRFEDQNCRHPKRPDLPKEGKPGLL
jgi:hypothetical protein